MAEDDEYMQSMTRDFRGGTVSLQKSDIDVGSQFSKNDDGSVPRILKNLDYSGIEEDAQKQENGNKAYDDTVYFSSDSEVRDTAADSRFNQEASYSRRISNA